MLDLGIRGRKAIVCASSRGLGWACARSLAVAGVEVIINGRNEQQLQVAAHRLAEQTGAAITPVAADVTTIQGRQTLLAACPWPDILVNNADGPPLRDFRELDHDAMIQGLEANMLSPIEMIRLCLDGMTERGFGRIVNITSFTVKMPVAGLDLSSGARAGLTSFVAGIAREVAHANVTINQLLPGYFDTERLQGVVAKSAKSRGISEAQAKQDIAATIPARRVGRPEEFGDACAFLCSANAGYLTGQNLLLDGGIFPSAF